ncbi:transcription intermediary factor 1-alpha isoform X1 [Megalobrama amblycephala]|uniref:transcription intermediary factor 1-alpha isoform X1 n=1 Tax=Megalobrama amblycephala TaxID=75352 RepID=UPI002014172E|nr:transcription intermediary factor 1-alpha isoform X1 [Megalobrama amblycephala]
MFTPDQTGRQVSPHLDLEKTVCGSCAICKLRLNSSADPRLLPCLHTVCNTCLTKICTDGATQDCPLCAQTFCLSDVTECVIFEDDSNNNKPPKCAGCEESEVSGWCVQCEEALCLDCMSAHRRVKVTRDHEVTPKNPPTGWIQRRRCPLHTQESLRFFCLVCEELTCKDCQLITHRGHSFVQQEEAVGSQRQQLQSLLDSIRHQKEMISSSLLLLEARLQDIENLKVAAKKMLRQVVFSLYQALLLKATQILKDIEALYAEEGRCLLERKTSLNRLEGFQDYIVAFIDKILNTEGHCLLVHTKTIETQVKKLLSQETCTPETMIKLHVQIQNDLCQQMVKFGFMKIRKTSVPFSSMRTGSTQSKSVSVESSNPNSVVTATDVHPIPASPSVDAQVQAECVANSPALHSCVSSQTVQMNQALKSLLNPSQPSQPSQPNQATQHSFQLNQSKLPSSEPQNSFSSSFSSKPGQSKNAYTPSSHRVPYFPNSAHKTQMNPHPSVNFQPRRPFTNCPASQINDISKRKKTWTLHYYSPITHPMAVKNQTPVLTHPIPANNQTPVLTHPIPANNQTPVQTHPIPANNQTPVLTHPIPANNQTPVLTHPIPANNQTPVLTHPIPANNQTPVLTHPIPANNQTPVLTHPIPANNQTPVLTHPLPANYQIPLLTSPTPANNQTPVLTHPIPAINQTPVLTQPNPADNHTSVLSHHIPAYNQTPVLTRSITDNNQKPVLTHSIPDNNQTLVITYPMQANNQTPVPTQPVSNMPTDTQTVLLTYPVQTSFLGPGHTFAAQPNIPLTVLSTINALSSNNVTTISNVHSAGPSNGGMNHCSHDPCAQNTTSPTFKASGSSLPVNPIHSAPISGNNTLWCKRDTYNTANLPVKALADSVSDQDAGVSSTNFTDTENSESNFPSSTVSETDPKESSPDPAHSSGLCNLQQDPLSTTTTEKCSRQAQASQSFTKSDSRPKHWSVGLPTTFRQLVETTPVSSTDNWKATPPANSTPCGTSDDLAGEREIHDKTVQSVFYHTKAKEEEKESAVTVEQFKKQFKRFPRVSLVRLPISLPPCGQPLPEFHLTADISRDHIMVQESQGGQIKQVWRWHEDPVPSRSSSCSIPQSSDSSPASDVQFCAVCQSAGAALLCAKCGCAFHSDCHIPPILTKPCEDWVCLLCQDVNETVVYGSEEMRTSSLSLPDQRKCEKLLLGLLCDENRCLLYSATKNHSKTAEFDIILGRLLGTRKPPYRTAAELVSDVWTLFDILMMNSERKNLVVKLQESFQQRLNETFGKSLHASLLKHSSSEDPRSTSETETQREKHRNTLKRMREFFMENCGTAGKKSCTYKGKEKDGCGNTTAGEQ